MAGVGRPDDHGGHAVPADLQRDDSPCRTQRRECPARSRSRSSMSLSGRTRAPMPPSSCTVPSADEAHSVAQVDALVDAGSSVGQDRKARFGGGRLRQHEKADAGFERDSRLAVEQDEPDDGSSAAVGAIAPTFSWAAMSGSSIRLPYAAPHASARPATASWKSAPRKSDRPTCSRCERGQRVRDQARQSLRTQRLSDECEARRSGGDRLRADDPQGEEQLAPARLLVDQILEEQEVDELAGNRRRSPPAALQPLRRRRWP